MGDVIQINQKKVFTLSEAHEVFPIVKRITHKSYEKIKAYVAQSAMVDNPDTRESIENLAKKAFEDWKKKMLSLGCEVKGPWLVDFDNGEGYYCWQYPEQELKFFHGYEEGFQGRTQLH